MSSDPHKSLQDLAQQLLRVYGQVNREVLVVLSDKARQLGMPETAVNDAIDAIVRESSPLPPAASSVTTQPSASQPVQLQNSPLPPPSPPKAPASPIVVEMAKKSTPPKNALAPAEVFLAVVKKHKVGMTDRRLTQSDESKLAITGIKRCGLSPEFTEFLVDQYCQENEIVRFAQLAAEAEDPMILAFADECREAIATEGGVNLRSRVKMEARAEQLNLTKEQFNHALALVQPSAANDRTKLLSDAFVTELTKRFESLNVLRPDQIQHWQRQGVERFGLTPKMAQQRIHEVAKSCDVQLVSTELAFEMLRKAVEAAMVAHDHLDSTATQKLIRQGETLGLTEQQAGDHVRSVITLIQDKELATQRSDRFLVKTLVAIIGIAVCAIGFVAVLFTNRTSATAETGVETTDASLASGIDIPQWWGPGMLIAVKDARRLLPDLDIALKNIALPAPLFRKQAYSEIVASHRNRASSIDMTNDQDTNDPLLTQPAIRQTLETLIIQSYLVESDAAARDVLRRGLLAGLNPNEDRADTAQVVSPVRSHDYSVMLQKMDLALAVLDSPDAMEAPRKELIDYLENAIPGDGRGESLTNHQWRMRLINHLGDSLNIDSPTDLDLDYRNFRTIATASAQLMSNSDNQVFVRQVLLKIAPTLRDSLGPYGALFEKVFRTDDGILLSQWVDAYERMKMAPAKLAFGRLLLDRAGLADTFGDDSKQVAAAVRDRFIIDKRALSDEQPSGWYADSKKLISKQPEAENRTKEMLKETTDLAWQFAMGEAIRHQKSDPSGLAAIIVEDLQRLGRWDPPSQTAARNTPTPRAPPAFSSSRLRNASVFDRPTELAAQRHMAELLDTLQKQRLAVGQSNLSVRLVSYSDRVNQLLPEVADKLAKYVLRTKTDQEHAYVLRAVSRWARWPYFQLAIAESLDGRKTTPETQALLESILGKPIDTTQREWETEVRIRLVESASHQQLALKPSDRPDTTASRAADYLTEIYRLKSRLRGNVIANDKVMSPGDILLSTVEAYAQYLTKQSGTEPQATSQWVKHSLRAIDVYPETASDPVQQIVMLQRIYLHLLAAELVRNAPQQQSAVESLLEELALDDANHETPLAHLRSGERCGVSLLLLTGEAP